MNDYYQWRDFMAKAEARIWERRRTAAMQAEMEKMELERRIFGRYLLVGSGESQAFWKSMQPRRARLRKLRRLVCRLLRWP